MEEAGIFVRWNSDGSVQAETNRRPKWQADIEQYATAGGNSGISIQEISCEKSVPMHSLESAEETEQWKAISCRGSLRFREAPALFALWFPVPEVDLEKFDRWYEDEHTPMLLKCADWLTVRRFSGSPVTGGVNRLVLHHLASESALESQARKDARATSAAQWFLAQGWFQSGRKQVFRRITPGGG